MRKPHKNCGDSRPDCGQTYSKFLTMPFYLESAFLDCPQRTQRSRHAISLTCSPMAPEIGRRRTAFVGRQRIGRLSRIWPGSLTLKRRTQSGLSKRDRAPRRRGQVSRAKRDRERERERRRRAANGRRADRGAPHHVSAAAHGFRRQLARVRVANGCEVVAILVPNWSRFGADHARQPVHQECAR